MKQPSNITTMARKIWKEPLHTELSKKYIDVSFYRELKNNIPDSAIALEEVFPMSELEEIWENFKPYLEPHKIFPLIGTLGETVICIGYGKENREKIYYFDFDFGKIPLNNDNLDDFIEKLKTK
ncbi:hypothetical protein ACGTN6_09505 [Halomonas sp. THAF12]|uniref:hypothetical protein n=1 Tax=Halomonas sp. B23F22_10 TaxID=3459515 RepID=UPI00373ED5E8